MEKLWYSIIELSNISKELSVVLINIEGFEGELKKGKIDKAYIFCGLDEELIKENIEEIIKRTVAKDSLDLNFIKLDGLNVNFSDIENACETLSFFGDKKVVLVYRANFLREKCEKDRTKVYSELLDYVKNLPDNTVLILYYLFTDKRESPKKNKKILALEKHLTVVHCDKLKKDKYYKKVEDLFKERGRSIGKIQCRYFADRVQNNFDIIKREIDKLLAYAEGREITKEDIDKLITTKSEDDIFDLVEYISQRKVERALDLLDELLFKADQHMLIVTSIQNHFKRLYEIKVYASQGKNTEFLMKKLRLPQFVCEKLLAQSQKFNIKQLGELIKVCVDAENKFKSSGTDKLTEMELMLFKTFMIK